MRIRKINDEVYVADEPIVRVGAREIAFLKEKALLSARKRARICAHRSNDDSLHEMIIALASRSYIRPHRHVSKSESFHIVEGQVDVAVFDDAGTIVDVIQMGAPDSGRCFYYRLSDSAFHTLIIHTDFLVIHEVTNGPFAVDGTVLADFAPPEGNEEQGNYMRDLSTRVAAYVHNQQV
jgi:cupin fold WbuC family metalloprotein